VTARDVEREALVDEQLKMRISSRSLVLPMINGNVFLSHLFYSDLCSRLMHRMSEIHVLLCMVIIHFGTLIASYYIIRI
jgi:hypothetical protein